VHALVFTRTGEIFNVGYPHATFALRDLKGLRYLHYLLRFPHKEYHSVDLLRQFGSEVEVDSIVTASDIPSLAFDAQNDAGPMLDGQAKSEYRRRLKELADELNELRGLGMEQRAERVESEMDALTGELARAVGLGGRDRRAGSAAERARLNVTRAIKNAIGKIAEHDSVLGAELSRTIKTGNFCSYSPDPDAGVTWTLSVDTPLATTAPTQPQSKFESQARQTGLRWVLEDNPFIGREGEYSILARNLERARLAEGRIVTIGGEAGVGKTRLSREFCAKAADSGFFVLVGNCYDREDSIPFIPFVELLESALAIYGPQTFRQMLGTNAPELSRLMPALLTIFPDIGAPLQTTPEQSRRILLNAVADVLSRCNTSGPTLLLLEDLHWADEGTTSLLEHLARSIQSLPLMIIVNFREDEGGKYWRRCSYGLSRLPHSENIRLERLPEREVTSMIRALSDRDPPAALASAIYAATEGNPLFVKELYEHLSESGKLFNSTGDFRRNLKLDEHDVPRGLKLLIDRRLARLGSEAHATLARAAILGRSFSFDLLEACCETDSEAILEHLERAEDLGILNSGLEHREAKFYFAHDLIRMSIVSELSTTRQQRLHLAAADAIETRYQNTVEDRATDLAHHLLYAGALARPERTIKYLTIAAKRAMLQSGYQTATQHLKNALEMIPAIPGDAERDRMELGLLLDYGVGVFTTQGWAAPEVGSAYAKAHTLCEKLGNSSARVFVLSGLWSFHLVRADHLKARAFATELTEAAALTDDDDAARVLAGWALGACQFFMGEPKAAHATFTETLRRYDKNKHRSLIAQFAQDAGVCCSCFDAMAAWMLGQPKLAEKRAAEALELARAIGDQFVLVWCLTMLSNYKSMRRDFTGIDALIEEGRAIARENGYSYYAMSLRAYRTISNFVQGNLEGTETSDWLYSKEHYLAKPWVYSEVAEALGKAGRLDAGLDVIDEALQALEETAERYYESEVYRVRGMLTFMRANQSSKTTDVRALATAEQDLQSAVDIARARDAKMFELRATIDLARILAATGRRIEGMERLRDACGSLEEGGDAFDQIQARDVLKQLAAHP
jgi:predicted ATPase